MIIAQVCLRLVTIKGHSIICSFTVLGCPDQSVNQSVSSVNTICLMQCNTSPSHRVDQVVDCGLWDVGPLLFNGCVKLHAVVYAIQSIPNMLNGWPVLSVCWPCKNWDVFSFQELCTDPCNMRWWSRMNCTTMGLRISSGYLCAFKMPWIKCTCVRCPSHTPAHTITPPPPWATRSTMLISANCSPTHNGIHAVCHLPCTVKTGIHPWREQLSKVPYAIECEHLPTQVGYNDELQSGRDPDEDDEHADELPWDGFWQFVQKLFGYANRLLQQLSGWLVSDDLGGEDAGCGGPGLVWLHVICSCEAGWMYCQILWSAFGDGLW